MNKSVRNLIAAGLTTLCAATASAASPMSVTTTVQKEIVVRDAKGVIVKTNLVPADKVVPGDTVVYTYHLENTGKIPSEHIVLVAPIPTELKYVNNSAKVKAAAITYSIDKGKTFAEPDKLVVVEADGKRRPAGPDDYTHIRWLLTESLTGGASRDVAFRAVLE